MVTRHMVTETTDAPHDDADPAALRSGTDHGRRDRSAGLVTPRGAIGRDAVTVGVGLIAWFVVVRYLHAWLFGVAPLA